MKLTTLKVNQTVQATLACALLAVTLSSALPASAAVWAWDSAPGGNTFGGAYWTSGTVPGAGTSTPATGDGLYFGGSSVTNLNNNDSGFSFTNFIFTAGAGSYTITNNSFNLNGTLVDASTNAQYVLTSVALSASESLYVTNSGSLTLGGPVSGTAFGLTLSGPGTATLTNNNTYTGGTLVNAGTLVLNFANVPVATNILAPASALTLGGGTLQIQGKPSATTAQTNASLTLTANTRSLLAVSQNSATAVNLSLGGLTRNGGSTLDVTLPTAGATVTTTTTTTGNNKVNGNGIAYATANSGASWLTNSGVSSAALGALAAGSYSADGFGAGADADIQNNDSPAVFTANTLRFNVASKTVNLSAGISQLTAGGILVTTNGTGAAITGNTGAALQGGSTGKEIAVHDYATLNLGAVITNSSSGASSVTFSGPGATTVSGANLYTGGTVINSGTVKLAVSTGTTSGAFGPTNTALTISPVGTLDLNGNNLEIGAYAAPAVGAIITNSSSTLATITMGAANGNDSGVNGNTLFCGNVKLVYISYYNSGSSSTRSDLGGVNTHTGGLTLSGNNLNDRIGNSFTFGTGPLTFGGSYGPGGFFVPSSGLSGNWGAISNNVAVVGTGNIWSFQGSSGGYTFGFATNSAWTGTGSLLFVPGFLPTVNFLSDMTAFQGTLIFSNNSRPYNLANSVKLGVPLGVITLGSATTNSLQYTGGGNVTVPLGDLNTSGSGAVVVQNATAATTVTWQVGGLGANSVFGGIIGANGTANSALTKVGTGTWTLAGANTYTGPTAVSNGVLAVTGSLAAGSTVTVSSPGAIGGSGTINGPVILNPGATFTNGNGSTLNLANGLTLSNGSVLDFALGTASDAIALTGGTVTNNVTTTPVTVNLQNLAGFAAGTYTLISNGGIAGTNNFVLGAVPSGYSAVLQSDGTDLQAVVTLSALSTAWWKGGASASWNNSGNWNTDQTSGINAGNYPSAPTAVNFSANSAGNLATTLGQNFSISSLTFAAAASVGIGGAYSLTLGSGILNTSSAGNNVISNASVILSLDQTWENDSAANPLTITAPVSGSHALTTVGLVILSGTNSYGATTISSGTLQIGTGGAGGSLGSGPVTNNSSLLFDITGSLVVNGLISGSGSVTNAASGTVALNTAATYSGNTVINAGAIRLGVANAIPGGPGNGNVTVNGTLDLNTYNETANGLIGSGIIDSLAGGTPTLTVGTNGSSSTFNGVIRNTAGTLSLYKADISTVTLAGTSTYGGQTTIGDGTLAFNGPAAMSPNSILAMVNGSVLGLRADTNAVFTPAGIATFPGAAFTTFDIDANNLSTGANAVLTLNGALTFGPTTQGNYGVWEDELAITGGNGYTVSLGAITGPNNGTSGNTFLIDVASGMALDIASYTWAPGGTGVLQIQDTGSTTITNLIQPSNRNLAVNLTGPGTVTINGNAQHLASNAAATFNYNLTGGQLNINSPKALLGDNAGNTFTGILNVGGGNLDNTSGSSITLANAITQNWNADFTFIGSTNLNFGIGPVILGGSRNVTVNASTLTVGGVLTDGGSGYTLTKAGSGALILAGTVTNTAGLTVSAGTLGLTTALAGGAPITIADGATLQLTVAGTNQTSPASITLGGSSGANVTFQGVSSTTLVPVSATTLTLNGASVVTIASGTFTVGSTYPLIAYGSETGGGNVTLGPLPRGLSGTLTDTGTNIELTITALVPEYWTGAHNGTWDITTSIDWTQGGAATNYTDGSVVVFNDAATGTTAITNIAAVSPSSITFSNSTKTYSLSSGAIGGSGLLTLAGGGTVILKSTNLYTGGTVINVGTLQLGDGATNSGAVAGNITDNGTLVFASPVSQTYAGNITGTGSVVATNNGGTLTLSGASTFTGALVVKAGSVYSSNPAGFEAPVTGFGVGTNSITLGDVANGLPVSLIAGGAWDAVSQPVTVTGSGSRLLQGTWNSGGQVQSWGDIILANATVSFQQTAASPMRYQAADGITGVGNIIATNLSSGFTDFRTNINNTGWVRNDSTGTGGIGEGSQFGTYGSFGSNVTSLIQNSAASTFNLNAANPAFLGTAQVLVGTMTLQSATALNASNTVAVAGGATLDIQGVNETIAGVTDVSGAGGTVTDSTATGLNSLSLAGGGTYAFHGALAPATPADMSLTVNLSGSGIQTLAGTNTYTGNTTINAGTLALSGSGSLASSNLIVNGGATLSVSGLSTPFALVSGQTLNAGNGTATLAGPANLAAGAFVLNFTNGTPALNITGGSLNLGGAPLTVNVAGPALASGSYLLVTTGSGGSVTGTLPASLTVTGASAATNDTVAVTGGQLFLVVPPLTAAYPTNLTSTVNGSQLVLSWPADHAGWHLQVQTNPVTVGLGTNWVTIPGSDSVTSVTNTIDPAQGAVFYRMIYP